VKTAILACTVMLAACTSGEKAPAPTPVPEVTGFVRGCDSAVFGEPNMRNAISIGPLALVGIPQARRLPPKAFRPHNGRYGAIKVLAVVEGHEDVTVTVARNDRRTFALLYDPNARANKNGFLFSSGEYQVTFEACPGGTSLNYNGGFIARQPTCATLQVETETSSQEGSLTVGGGSCP
jgi:hypothetical protein